MPKCQCKNCGRIWYGWAKNNICPHCGAELKKMEETKKNKVVFAI